MASITEGAAEKCAYLASRGLSGIKPLQGRVRRAKAKGEEWVTQIQLHGAVMNGHEKSTLPFLLASVGSCLLDLRDEIGNTALMRGIIWGKNSCVVYLLSKGARTDILNAAGQSALELARLRQKKLITTRENPETSRGDNLSAADFKNMVDEAADLVSILQACEQGEGESSPEDARKRYNAWALQNASHPLVVAHSPWAIACDNRMNLCVLRALLISGRAVKKTEVEILEEERAYARLQAERESVAAVTAAAQTEEKISTLETSLAKAGLLEDRCYARSLRILGVSVVQELLTVNKEMIAQLDLTAKERRTLWIFIGGWQDKLGALKTSDVEQRSEKKKPLSRQEKKALAERQHREEQERRDAEMKKREVAWAIDLMLSPELDASLAQLILQMVF